MPRWRQSYNPETGKSEFIPLDEQAARRDAEAGGIIVKGKFDPFVSPIDGSRISNQKEYDDHCKRHNVVPSSEFSPEFYARKAKERERFYNREFTDKEKLARKREIYEAIVRAERNG
jgi:hypothetical protein